MNETTELIMKQLNSKKVHAETHEVGGGDEIDVTKLKNIDSYVTKTGDFSGTWNGLAMTSVDSGLATAFNALKAEKATYYSNVAAMIADTSLKNGYKVVTLGYYAENDGGGATYIISNDALVADDCFVYTLSNGLKAKMVIEDNKVNVLSVGIKADGISVPYTYSGTSTVLDGTTRNFITSSSGETNKTKFQKLLDYGCKIYAPSGTYVFSPNRVLMNDNTVIYGDGIDKTIFACFNISNVQVVSPGVFLITDKGSNFSISDLTITGVVDVTPPLQCDSIDFNGSFNPATMWDVYDVNHIYTKSGTVVDAGQTIEIQTPSTKNIDNIRIERVKFKNKSSCIGVGTKTTTTPTYTTNNIKIKDCVFETQLGQPIGSNNVRNIKLINNRFKDCYFQPFDLSRGSVNAEVAGNLFDKCAQMGKVTGNVNADNTRILSDKFEYHDNLFINPPLYSEFHWKGSAVVDDLVGDGNFYNNIINVPDATNKVINTTIKRQTTNDNLKIFNNQFLATFGTNTSTLTILYINNDYNASSYASKNVEFYDNTVQTNRKSIIFGCYGNVDKVKVKGNRAYVTDAQKPAIFYDGIVGSDTVIEGNYCNEAFYILNNATANTAITPKILVIKDNVILSSVNATGLFYNNVYINNTSSSNLRLIVDGNTLTEPRIVVLSSQIDTATIENNHIKNSFITRSDSLAFCTLAHTLSSLTLRGNRLTISSANSNSFKLIETLVNLSVTEGVDIIDNKVNVPNLSVYSGFTLNKLFMGGNHIKSGAAIAVDLLAAKGLIGSNMFDSSAVTIDGKTNSIYVDNNRNVSGTLTVTNNKP